MHKKKKKNVKRCQCDMRKPVSQINEYRKIFKNQKIAKIYLFY